MFPSKKRNFLVSNVEKNSIKSQVSYNGMLRHSFWQEGEIICLQHIMRPFWTTACVCKPELARVAIRAVVQGGHTIVCCIKNNLLLPPKGVASLPRKSRGNIFLIKVIKIVIEQYRLNMIMRNSACAYSLKWFKGGKESLQVLLENFQVLLESDIILLVGNYTV